MSTVSTLTARWSLSGYAKQYPWPQCRYCGRAAGTDCRPVDCLWCGSRQCHGNGSGNGACRICLYGWLPGWSRLCVDRCGYAHCDGPAVTTAPRVGRACAGHAERVTLRVAGRTVRLTDYTAERVAARDAGTLAVGTERWRWVA